MSRMRARERPARYASSAPPSKPTSPSEAIDPTTRTLPEATEEVGPKYGRYNYMNFPPDPKVWRPQDFSTIATEVFQTGDVRPSTLTSHHNQLPSNLSRKTVHDVTQILDHLHAAFDQTNISFAPECTVPSFLAILASEILFMNTHAHERNLALYKLVRSRSMLTNTESSKSAITRDLKRLKAQTENERKRRIHAIDRKAKLEDNCELATNQLLTYFEQVDDLRQQLETAKMNDLEVRRRLDRIRLKVGALRGEMVVPTVEHLVVREARRHPGPDGDAEQTNEVHPSFAKFSGRTTSRHQWQADNSSGSSSMPTASADDCEMDVDEEAMEYRLLKNRLGMVEAEANEWKETLRAERIRYQLAQRAKTQLEEDVAKMKQGGGAKPSNAGAGRPGGKTDQRSHAKIRSAVRASISLKQSEMSPRKLIRKGRKTKKPIRALAPAL